MTRASENAAQQPYEDAAADRTLDSGASSDDNYLQELGYEPQLKRTLGLFNSFAVQFSALAIFSAGYTGMSIGLFSFGPAFIWAWIIGGALQVFVVGLVVAELVSAYPVAGGVYQITNRIGAQVRNRVLRSKLIGWQAGWWIVIAHTVSVPATAYLMSPFLFAWFGNTTPSAGQQMWFAIGVCVVSTVLNVAGVKVAARSNDLAVIAELVAGAIIIVALAFALGGGRIDPQPLSIFFDTAGTATDGNWLAAFAYALLMPLFFIQSFDSTGNAAEETKDAARTAPLGVFIANSSAWVMGIVFFALCILAIPDLALIMGSASPATEILQSAVGQTVTSVFQGLAVLALLGNAIVIQLTGARMLWALARDGEMPGAHFLSKVSKTQVPVNATYVTCGLSIIITVIAAQSASVFTVLVGLTALAWAAAYAIVVCYGCWALLTGKLPARPFNLGRFSKPVFCVGVVWAVAQCGVLVWQNPLQVGGGMAAAILVGVLVYALIPKRDAVHRQASPADAENR